MPSIYRKMADGDDDDEGEAALIEDEAPEDSASSRSQCTVCHRSMSVTRLGLIRVHGPVLNRCPGLEGRPHPSTPVSVATSLTSRTLCRPSSYAGSRFQPPHRSNCNRNIRGFWAWGHYFHQGAGSQDQGHRIRAETGEPLSLQFLMQGIAMAVQQGNAAAVRGTSPPTDNGFIWLFTMIF